MAFYKLQSAYNLSDMCSKHWDHPSVCPMILKLHITRGNITQEAPEEKGKGNNMIETNENKKVEEKENIRLTID